MADYAVRAGRHQSVILKNPGLEREVSAQRMVALKTDGSSSDNQDGPKCKCRRRGELDLIEVAIATDCEYGENCVWESRRSRELRDNNDGFCDSDSPVQPLYSKSTTFQQLSKKNLTVWMTRKPRDASINSNPVGAIDRSTASESRWRGGFGDVDAMCKPRVDTTMHSTRERDMKG